MERSNLVSHAEAANVLRNAGHSQKQIDDVLRHLDDTFDVERDSVALTKLGLSIDTLTDRMGGSP